MTVIAGLAYHHLRAPADRAVSAFPCSAARGRRDSRAASPATGAARQHPTTLNSSLPHLLERSAASPSGRQRTIIQRNKARNRSLNPDRPSFCFGHCQAKSGSASVRIRTARDRPSFVIGGSVGGPDPGCVGDRCEGSRPHAGRIAALGSGRGGHVSCQMPRSSSNYGWFLAASDCLWTGSYGRDEKAAARCQQ